MEKIYFNSSSGGSYDVEIEIDGQQVFRMRCNCPAGSFGQLCKHLKAFFESNSSFLHRPEQHARFRELCEAVKISPIYDDWNRIQAAYRSDVEYDMDAIKTAFVSKLRGVG